MTLEWETMVLVGRVARAHGNRGRVIVNPDSDFVEDRFRPGNTVYVRHGDRVEPLSIRDVRFHQHRPIVAFDEVATMTEAEQLASAELRVPMDTLERLPAGVFYHHELTGCRVETVEGAVVGSVPRGLPSFVLPHLDVDVASELAIGAAFITVIGLLMTAFEIFQTF